MVWCGVVWCGVVWCSVVWCGVVWCYMWRGEMHGIIMVLSVMCGVVRVCDVVL